MDWLESRFQTLDVSFDTELDQRKRILSPSDFGYHNVLRRGDGNLVFIDFEYFGWDDPAKLVSDFLLHPANDLADVWKRQFLTKVIDGYRDDEQLETRVGTLYPLIGLKWTLLLLNEFIPEHLERRRFSDAANLDQASTKTLPGTFDESKLQARQLELAKDMLRRSAVEFEKFPYTNQLNKRG